MLNKERLLGLIDRKVDAVRKYVLPFKTGVIDWEAQHADLIFKCDIYYFDSEELIIPLGTKSVPYGISRTTADIIIFINEGDQNEKIYLFIDDLKKIIKENATRDVLFFDDVSHNSMCIKLNKNKLTNGKEKDITTDKKRTL